MPGYPPAEIVDAVGHMENSMLLQVIVLQTGMSIGTPMGQETPLSIDDSVAQLCELGVSGRPAFGRHGEPADELRAVLQFRHDATLVLCSQLEHQLHNQGSDTSEAILYCLGCAHDPRLLYDARFTPGQRFLKTDESVRAFLRGWRGTSSSASSGTHLHLNTKWLTDEPLWCDFFQRLLASRTTDADRLQVLEVMGCYLHSTRALTFCERNSQDVARSPLERMASVAYLWQHRKQVDASVIGRVMDELGTTPSGRAYLLQIVQDVPHESFVPWLIRRRLGSVLLPEEERWYDVALRHVTCAPIADANTWREWYDTHGKRGVSVWLDDAVARIPDAKLTNPGELRSPGVFLDGLGRRPECARRLLPFGERVEMRDDLVLWISKSYHPAWRRELAELAQRVISVPGAGPLRAESVQSLRELDFLTPEVTWKEYVDIRCHRRH